MVLPNRIANLFTKLPLDVFPNVLFFRQLRTRRLTALGRFHQGAGTDFGAHRAQRLE
jgi:hypothetical protein